MWINRGMFNAMNALIDSAQNRNTEMLRREGAVNQRVADLEAENMRLQRDNNWFMHRLTQVENERAQLIHAAIGVKFAAPTFRTPEPSTEDVLNAIGGQFPEVGGDSLDPADALPTGDGTESFANLPGYQR